MFIHAAILLVLCLTFPIISNVVMVPLMADMFMNTNAVISEGNTIIMIIMIGAIFIVPLVSYIAIRDIGGRKVPAYMSGINVGDNENFVDSFGNAKEMHVANWYMDEIFGERKLLRPSVIGGIIIVIVFLSMLLGGAVK